MQCFRFLLSHVFSVILLIQLSGCGSMLPGSGPKTGSVMDADRSERLRNIKVIDLSQQVVTQLAQAQQQLLFSEVFNTVQQPNLLIGAGDILEVSIWEVPPALFSGVFIDQRSGAGATQKITFPEQMVTQDGTINIPFAGHIPVTGKTTRQIESVITGRLNGKANQPQVLVRTVRNNTANVTVVGEVASSTRMPLTSRTERLLDALAAAGGVRQPVSKMTLQLTRGKTVQAMPLDHIIRDPLQNVVLQSDDVVTLMHQPLSFTAFGATGKNEEVNFEAQGISLAQALARVGGIQDNRADAKGVFVFRFGQKAEEGLTAGMPGASSLYKQPVIYSVNLRDPASFFLAQNFMMQNKDILYVSNAPSSDLQKFLNMVVSVVYPIVNISNAVQ
jgi:polysaccharide export outer membrane protein